jgi:hypothetical protein
MIRAVPAQPARQPPAPAATSTEETTMPGQPHSAALRAQLLDELARMDAVIQLADRDSRDAADPLMTIAAQEARHVRDRILDHLDQLDQVVADRITRLVMDDPAVQAAGDQFRAARNGPPPSLDHDTWAQGQADALRLTIGIALRRMIDEAGIPADRLPAALEIAARLLEQQDQPPDP